MTLLLLLNPSQSVSSGAPQAATSAVAAQELASALYGNEQETPFIWVVEILSAVTNEALRFARNTHSFTFQTDSEGQPIEWLAANFTVGAISTDNEGRLSNYSLSIQNVTREIGAYMEYQDGLTNSRVRMMLVDISDLASPDPLYEVTGQVLSGSVTDSAVSLSIGKSSLQRKRFPSQRVNRDYCRHEYVGPACGYSVPQGSEYYLPTCDLTLNGANGCSVHGDSETSHFGSDQGLHPERWGGFLGLIRSGGLQ